MGTYTEIFFRAEVDAEAHGVLERMAEGYSWLHDSGWPDHPLFSTDRFLSLMACGSYYFPGANHLEFEKRTYDEGVCVSFRANLKNYGSEIEKFFDWVAPHVLDGEGTFLGYSLYEEADVPRLYFKGGQ